jgi:nucleotide-binding universal stress UspA family protein
MFSKILVPYDDSKLAERALNKAIYLGKLSGGSEVIILTVIEEIKSPSMIFDTTIRNYKTGEANKLSSYLRDVQKEMRHEMINRLDDLKRKYQSSVQMKTLISVGRPEVKIVEYANNQHVDLIVMGNRGLRGISRFMMGSVSRTVLEKVKCTVMIVR